MRAKRRATLMCQSCLVSAADRKIDGQSKEEGGCLDRWLRPLLTQMFSLR